MIYLDAAATTPVRRQVLEAMWPYLSADFGNASSRHALGASAARALTSARERIAALLSCRASEIVFTSGGTEADNLALKGVALANPRGRHILISAIEHEAVRESCDYLHRHHGFTIETVPVDANGCVSVDALTSLLRSDTTLCSVMLANNEIGTIQPVAELAVLARLRGARVHTDAVQACGSLPLNVNDLHVEALSISGHKFGAPKGVGALYLRRGLAAEPLLHGGGQERGQRSGTENVAGVVALATAMELTQADFASRVSTLTATRDALIDGILHEVPHAMLTGHRTERLPNHASFCFPTTSGEAVLLQLEERGILCSSGSACAAGSSDPSSVLLALGIAPQVAQTAVRFTFTESFAHAQVPEVVRAVRESVATVESLR